MKKVFILMLFLCLSLTACSESETAAEQGALAEQGASTEQEVQGEQQTKTNEEIFNEIMAEVTNPTSADLKMYSESEMIFADSTNVTTSEHEIKYDMRDESNIKYSGITSTDVLGTGVDVTFETYYLDGYFYYKMGESKTKAKVEAQVAFPMVDYSSSQLNAQELINFELIKEAEHDVFKYSINEESLSEQIEEITRVHNIPSEIEFVTASGETVISKDGQILESYIEIEVKVTAQSLNATIITRTHTEYYSINEDIEIVYPEDLESYVLV